MEDDEHLGYLLSDKLVERNYETTWEKKGDMAWRTFLRDEFDLCLLDILLPGIDGIELARRMRSRKKDIPIIFITARSLKSDVITGYEAGCDDYIIKPFETYELLLKIRALLLRSRGSREELQHFFEMGNFTLDSDLRQISWPGGGCKINRTENEIFRLLLEAEGRVVQRNYLLDRIWGRSDIYTSKSLDTYIYNVRKYLKQTNLVLENIYGAGYVLKVHIH